MSNAETPGGNTEFHQKQLPGSLREQLRRQVDHSPAPPAVFRQLIDEPFPFTIQQLRAIFTPKSTDSPVLVRATPGSGKTSVLTARYLVRLLAGESVPKILAVTFTRRAAREMRVRIEDRLQTLYESSPVPELRQALADLEQGKGWIRTFHSMALELLTEPLAEDTAPLIETLRGNFGSKPAFLGRERLHQWTREVLERKAPAGNFTVENVLRQITDWKMNLVSPERASNAAMTDLEFISAEVFRLIRMRKEREGVLDYFDLVYLLGQIVRKRPAIRRLLQQRFGTIMVDEFQDTNPSQQLLIRKLSAKETSLFVVGDPFQSIFQWRGAHPRGITHFEQTFPGARVISLRKNFRSRALITLTANEIFKDDREFSPMKPCRRTQTTLDYGDPPGLFVARDGREELEFLRFTIKQKYQNSPYSYSDIGILVRTNSFKQMIRDDFSRRRIPIREMGRNEFFQHGTTHAFVDALRWLMEMIDSRNQLDRSLDTHVRESLCDWLTHPVGPLDPEQSEWIMRNVTTLRDWNKLAVGHDLGEQDCRRLRRCQQALRQLRGKLRDEELLSHHRRTLSNLFFETGQPVFTNHLRECWQWLERSVRRDGVAGLRDLLRQFQLERYDSQHTDPTDGDGVWLSTLHAAKGLEFPVVFMPGVEEGWLPHQHPRMERETNPGEERRLFFVGMTRARDRLILSYARQRTLSDRKRDRSPSRYLDEIPEEFLHVRQPKFNFLAWGLSWLNRIIPT